MIWLPSRKKIDEAWRNIKKMLRELNYEVLQDLKDRDGNYIGLLIKFGNYQVQIIHPPNREFMGVGFRIDFDDGSIKKIKELHRNEKQWREFIFSLQSQVSSPITGNHFFYDKENTIIGYSIEKRIFPFHEGFSIEKLYNAIQAVVSVGYKGIIFLAPIFGKELKVEATPEPPPHMVYG